MKIRTLDGSVLFTAGPITENMDRPAFLQSEFGKSSRVIVTNEPWITYSFVAESGVKCSARFNGDRLHQVFLLMSMPTDDPAIWTAELELQRKLKHDQWLRAELGPPPYDYPWGSIASEFDPRGCVSGIIITYAGRPT